MIELDSFLLLRSWNFKSRVSLLPETRQAPSVAKGMLSNQIGLLCKFT